MKLKDVYTSPAKWMRENLSLIRRHYYEKPNIKVDNLPPKNNGSSIEDDDTEPQAQLQQPFKRLYLAQKNSLEGQGGSRISFPGKGIKQIEKMPSLRSLVDNPDNDTLYDVNSHLSEEIYGGSRRSTIQIQKWDVFREIPIEESNSGNQKCLEHMIKILKLVSYVVCFILVLCTGVVSKGIVLFMTSQIGHGRKTPFCRLPATAPDKKYEAEISPQEQAQWIWAIALTYLFPELFTLFRSARMCIFKSFRRPKKEDFLLVFLFESLHAVGMALLLFVVLPEIDAIKGAMLTNCMCLIPAILALLSRHKTEEKRVAKVVIDVLSIVAQASGLFVWPVVLSDKLSHAGWALPTAVVLISFGWWENYVDGRSSIGLIRHMAKIKDRLKRSRYFIYSFVSFWKMLVFLCSMVGFISMTSDSLHVDKFFFLKNFLSVEPRSLVVRSVNNSIVLANLKKTDGLSSLLNLHSTEPELESVAVVPTAAVVTLVIQVICALVCYVVGKFACRICIQGFSYAFPVNLTIPVTISLLIAACGVKNSDVCFLKDSIPRYLYWVCPRDDSFVTFISEEQAWVWLLWLLSQTWITLHVWIPKCERLASTERLFVTPMYNGVLIDQSLGMNRRRDEEDEVKTKDLDIDSNPDDRDAPCYETISEHTESAYAQDGSGAKSIDQITHIFACATMWHETDEEMMEMLKSIMRMDEDQSARRNAQKYLQIVDPDYYEFETHIFFDDAFEMCDEDEDENVVNRFVKSLVRVIDDAASKVHQCTIRIKPPTKLPTPYGGRLVWTLPGKTKMIAHLKDKSKIRHRKRWSQVMYMYYLLGHRLMERDLDVNRKEAMAENTYLLTLDGDIDFQPHAVQLLVDLMKKNRNLGAACGRIHPIGSGLMQWYQKFEYAMGHWLQKATEHMIGCVLCSPGCFSLFRAKALMDDNVMRRYTMRSNEARHYVQYDQGEDRWLCTLLLQRGYRVEYSAASDAYTHCPEGFNEFFNQRRRWVPSTMANILDLLVDSHRTVKVNDNISTLYIIYQGMLMVGTILGPGTIFLMLVGAFVAAFKIDNWTSFYANIVPILFFMIICFIAKSEHQLLIAQIFSAGYALVMMAVLVGISLQMREDGIGSPSFIFFVMLSGSFFVAAILHPQEFSCIVPGLLYYLSIPSMYLLLIIYSLINLNNVSWGTREVLTKKTREELEEQRRQEEEAKKNQRQHNILGLFGAKDNDEMDGSLTVSFANLCSFMMCTYPKPKDEQIQLLKVQDTLDGMVKRLDYIEKAVESANPNLPPRRRSFARSTGGRSSDRDHLSALAEEEHDDEDDDNFSTSSGSGHSQQLENKRKRDDLLDPYWIEDKDLKRGPIEYLPGPEIQFWKDLLGKYLYPIDANKDEQARLTVELKELRNKAVFAFFMFNALFILIVFLLQLNKDNLYVDWPLGVKTNISYDETTKTISISKEYLHLEPIGFVFVIFFALIVAIQFVGMLFHRFGTLSHILASTEISCCNRKVEDVSDDVFIQRNAVEIARAFQRLRGLDGEDEGSEDGSGSDHAVGRRKTIHNLEKSMKRKQRVGTLDVAFRQRFFNLNAEGKIEGTPVLNGMRKLSMRRETMQALAHRRNTMFNNIDRERMRTLGAKNSVQPHRSRHRQAVPHASLVFTNNGNVMQGISNDGFDHSSEEEERESKSSRHSLGRVADELNLV